MLRLVPSQLPRLVNTHHYQQHHYPVSQLKICHFEDLGWICLPINSPKSVYCVGSDSWRFRTNTIIWSALKVETQILCRPSIPTSRVLEAAWPLYFYHEKPKLLFSFVGQSAHEWAIKPWSESVEKPSSASFGQPRGDCSGRQYLASNSRDRIANHLNSSQKVDCSKLECSTFVNSVSD